MQINDFLDISKSETEAFHIMYISCMNAIELIKYLLQVFFLHSHTRIFNWEIEEFVIIPGFHCNIQSLICFSVFNSIVHQIEYYILEMNLIHIDSRINSFNIRIDLSTCMLYSECKGVGNILHHLIKI